MKHFTVPVCIPNTVSELPLDAPAVLEAYLLDNDSGFRPERIRPAIIICPGGGYSHVSAREGEPVAIHFNSLGFQSFVLNYHVSPYEYPVALCELAAAVASVREHAQEWHVNPEQIVVAGFSAGGHLAANLCVSYTEDWLLSAIHADIADIHPNACILSYPVITSGEYAHVGSFERLLGLTGENDLTFHSPTAAKNHLLSKLSLEKQVTDSVPPTFLWHTFSDASVPVENTLLYASALCKANVLTELHIYPFGGHGLSLATEETSAADGHQIVPECSQWPELAVRFLRQVFEMGRNLQ